MHPEAFAFIRGIAVTLPIHEYGRVLEIGSYNVNGSVRPLLTSPLGRYLGIDVRAGPGVDQVIDCADYDGQGQFDVVVSTEVLEHMPHPADLIACAARALRPGGLLMLTAASDGRAPHGVNGGAVGDEAYANITRPQLARLLRGWDDVQITENPVAHDIYATARRV